MLVYRPVEAPCSELPRWPRFWAFRRPLALDQLLEVDPLLLWLNEQRSSCLHTKVHDDDTSRRKN